MTVPVTPRQLLSAQLGVVVPVDDAPALLEASGPRFDRLAWTGRALLPVQAVRQAASGLGDPVPVDDAALEAGLRATGVPELVGPAPLADVAAACVTAGYRTQQWPGALAVSVRIVSPRLREVRLPKALDPALALECGRAALQAAAALLLTVRSPEAEVADLAAQRAALPTGAEPELEQALVQVGRVLVVKGEQGAVEAALPLLRRR